MFDPSYKGYADKFPNIIYKRKLAALPLFNQNPAPIAFSSNATPQKSPRPLLGSNSAPKFVPNKLHAIASPKFMSEFKTVNNYTRLCDQPFLEFSNFHFEQIFGNGSGKRRVVLDPIQKKNDKKKIQKMYTMQNNSNLMSSSSIRIEDGSPVHPRFHAQNTIDPHGALENAKSPSHFKVQHSIREETEEQESPTKETESSQRAMTDYGHDTHAQIQSNRTSQPNTARSRLATMPNQSPDIFSERPESPTRIKKMYKIGDHEVVVAFTSLEVVLEQEDGPKLQTRLAKSMLRRIFKKTDKEIVQLVLEGLQLENESKLKIALKRQDRPSVFEDPQNTASPFYLDEPYPVKKSELKVELEGRQYEATITFPILEIRISQLDFHEKLTLKPRYLANLFEEKFDNLQDYFHHFSIPSQVYKSKEEVHEEKLRQLPTAIKKVIKTADFGGLMLFKSMEINLKNTSSVMPETTESTGNEGTVAEKIAKRRKKDVNNASIKINVADLRSLIKCNLEELIELIKESVSVQEGHGFAVNFDPENIKVYKHRDESQLDTFPEVTEKFMIRFNKYLYEAQIKFPTLELYVPETNFKDIIQLTYNQLQSLIGDCFQNMDDYMDQFKKPRVKVAEELPTIALLIPPAEDGSANEFAKLVATVAEKLGYKVNQGLMCKSTQVDSQQELENAEEATKFTDNMLVHQLAHVKHAVFAWETTATTTTNQSATLKTFLKGLSPVVKAALKDKKLFFVAETREEAAGLEEDLTKQWREGLNKVGVTLLKNLVVVKGDEAQQKVEERLKTLDEVLEAEKEVNEDN